MEINELAKEIHKNAISKGWWTQADTIPNKLLMIHSEVSEAVEAYRNNNHDDIPVEVADIIIRALDLLSAIVDNPEDVIIAKHEYNKTRSFRHGNKLL